MIRHVVDDLAFYTFESLARFPELVHGVTTRHGGVSSGVYSSLNISNGLGDDSVAVAENIRRACSALGLERDRLVSPRQRHTAHVRRVGPEESGRVVDDVDALLTIDPGVPLMLRYADCTPVLIFDPARRGISLIHSGWRGTVRGIVRAAVAAMESEFGSRPRDLVAAIGPSIGPCCYEVGGDVLDAANHGFGDARSLVSTGPSGRPHFDLWQANVRWLTEAGVRQIEVAGLCTSCRVDDFYSHRRDRGRTGHFGALMSLRE